MRLLKNNLEQLASESNGFNPNPINISFPQLPQDNRMSLVPKEVQEEKANSYKEGDKMRIPGVLDYTGAKYPFKKRLISKAQDGTDTEEWVRVKSNSGKYLYVPSRKNEEGEYQPIEYDAQGRFNAYEKAGDYNSGKHIVSKFTKEEKKNKFYNQKLYETDDQQELVVRGSKDNVGKIRSKFESTFGSKIGGEQYKLIEDMAIKNNLDLKQLSDKYFELYELSGRPKIGHEATAFQIFPVISRFIRHGDFEGWNREMYNPLTNYIHLESDPSVALVEFTHGYNNSDSVKEKFPQLKEKLSQYIFEPSDAGGYDNPYHNEYHAHKITQQLMLNYLLDQKENNFNNFVENYFNGKRYRNTYLDYPSRRLYHYGEGFIPELQIRDVDYDKLRRDSESIRQEVQQKLIYPIDLGKSGIKIKKKNRGKFTEYCRGNVTQECINRAKKSGNKTLIKRAVFAENARKWNK